MYSLLSLLSLLVFHASRFFSRRWLLGCGSGLASLLLAGCHYHQAYPDVREHRVFFNDFEHMEGWLGVPTPSLTTERAHSGRYSVKVDQANPYSVTYRLKLGDAFTMRPRRMRMSLWAWVESSREETQLIFSISAPTEPEKSKFYSQLYLGDNWPYKRWTHISRDFDLPVEVSSQAELAVYLWDVSGERPVYTDDWELTELH